MKKRRINPVKNSIFDSPSDSFHLWQKVHTSTNTIDQTKVVHRGQMTKIIPRKGKFQKRTFWLTKKYLIYCKPSAFPPHALEIRGLMQTKWVRTTFHTYQDSQNNFRFLIRFSRNQKFCDFWVLDEPSFLLWKSHLIPIFVQTDFHSNFKPLKILGTGSFAKVYLAKRIASQRAYAVKAFAKEDILLDSRGVEAMMNEIQILKELDSKFINQLYEVHETHDSVYLVLECLEGGTLLDYLKNRKNLTQMEIKNVMICLLKALDYLHKKEILHRDIKPGNLLLSEKQNLKHCIIKLGNPKSLF